MKSSDEILADNYRLLALERGWSMREVAERSKGRISHRHIQRLVNNAGGASLEKLDALADVFGIPSWQLLLPDLKPEAVRSPEFKGLIQCWLRADPASRGFITRFAEHEAGQKLTD